MIRIKFAESDNALGLMDLARRVKVVCLPHDEYLIALPNLGLLDQLGLQYQVLETEGFDSAISKVRGSARGYV